MNKPVTSAKVYLRSAKSEGYNLDFLLGLLHEGTIKAQGRYNPDYTDEPSIENPSGSGGMQGIKPIPTERWQEWTYSKQRHDLIDYENHACYSFISVDRKKLDVAFSRLPPSTRGAPKKYDDARFYQELCLHLIGFRSPTIKTHDAFCMHLYSALPYLLELDDTAPGIDWLKKKTASIWKKLENARNNIIISSI